MWYTPYDQILYKLSDPTEDPYLLGRPACHCGQCCFLAGLQLSLERSKPYWPSMPKLAAPKAPPPLVASLGSRPGEGRSENTAGAYHGDLRPSNQTLENTTDRSLRGEASGPDQTEGPECCGTMAGARIAAMVRAAAEAFKPQSEPCLPGSAAPARFSGASICVHGKFRWHARTLLQDDSCASSQQLSGFTARNLAT